MIGHVPHGLKQVIKRSTQVIFDFDFQTNTYYLSPCLPHLFILVPYYRKINQVFYWSFNVKDRVRSKVQVLKDCQVYIQELEKRVAPHVLHDLQENFQHYVDTDCQLTEDDDTTSTTNGEGGVKCATSCTRSGDLISDHIPHTLPSAAPSPQQLPRFETDQLYSKRKKFVKTTCEYEVEYYPHPVEQGFSVDRKGYSLDREGYSSNERYSGPDVPDNLIPRRYCFDEPIPHHIPNS